MTFGFGIGMGQNLHATGWNETSGLKGYLMPRGTFPPIPSPLDPRGVSRGSVSDGFCSVWGAAPLCWCHHGCWNRWQLQTCCPHRHSAIDFSIDLQARSHSGLRLAFSAGLGQFALAQGREAWFRHWLEPAAWSWGMYRHLLDTANAVTEHHS